MKKSLPVLLILLAALWVFNPDLDKHQSRVSTHYGSGLAGNMAKLVLLVGGLNYHDFLFFSTTTGPDGKLVSLGFLGKVLVFQP